MSNPNLNPSRIRSIYRALLRELPPRPSQPRSPLHDRVRETFSNEASQHEHAVVQAEQLVQYLKAQRQYVTLVERYNPGMNMDEEERVKLTARRVGMDLPIEYTTGGKS
ncbi:putative ras guanyl-nucleotide exchange factor RasGEF [Xylariales sp. AK1849]|nr:putative ras guanyl-nucleotide exchange factor RasGEF [Xylariales sp. AK1849]